jgi:ABC-type branched-subunit amino acid transport system substrate-binding protein
MTRTRSGAVVLLAVALAATACSTKSGGGGTSSSGGVKTGPGIADKTITLGVLTDETGVFASLGTTVTAGNQLAVDEINAGGGVCGRKISLVVQDHGYDVQKATSLYATMAPQIAGLMQLLGSPETTALLGSLKTDSMLAAPASWASTLLTSSEIQISGATYDVEMINGIQYLVDENKIKKGDVLGHIHVEGEYGANGLAGSKYAAEKLGMTVKDVQVKATDTDMTSAIGQLKSAGAKAVLLTTTPKQTASAVGVAAVGGFSVPFLGNNPTYSPLLLGTPVAAALEANLYVMGSSIPLSADNPSAEKVLAAYKAKFPKGSPNAGVTYGYGVGKIWEQTLKAACDAKDLTRAGIEAAFHTLKSVDTGGILAPLDYSTQGAIPAKETFVVRPSKATIAVDGLKIEKELFTSDLAKDYTPPTS